MKPLITNDAVVLGILLLLLTLVFQAEKNPKFKTFFTYVPGLLLCYFLPAFLNTFNVISHKESQLYFVASRYMLPASLVLLTISIDFPSLKKLGPKALIMFFTATLGIILGGPVALFIVSNIAPSIVNGTGDDAAWKGLSTIAGSWIGGAANQLAMKEAFNVSDKVYSAMAVVDVVTANIWMACLLYGAGISDKIDKWVKADNSAIKELEKKMAEYQSSIVRVPNLTDLMTIMGIAFGGVALSHFGADNIAPFLATNAPYMKDFSLTDTFIWVVILSTTIGLVLSFSAPIRSLEGVGASKIASLFLYFLVACVGMKMNFFEIANNLGYFLIGIIWMLTHIIILLSVAKVIKAPFFFVAVGSQANVGGAASAPVVASAFNPVLAPVGVLLAVLGYAVGTYGAMISGYLMKLIHNP
ncbi:MAG: DUF819 family protein [Bacteroidetes bacterium]|nr:MAG: DUF819 family protein [Bacteroidota bacterium]TAG94523.1 MAG: DUF819 family protein [Bacteroidota bacterium]